MPTQDFGVYPDSLTAGTEVSSTYEGRHVTVTAAELLTSDGSGVATKGLPCVFGIIAGNHGVGVCFATGTLTDLIPIDTEGIWNLSVVAANDAGNSLVTGGDELYINLTTGVISKIASAATNIPFGYALGQVASGDTAVIAVKVHWDPVDNWVLDDEPFALGADKDVSVEWDTGGTRLHMTGIAAETVFQIGSGDHAFQLKVHARNTTLGSAIEVRGRSVSNTPATNAIDSIMYFRPAAALTDGYHSSAGRFQTWLDATYSMTDGYLQGIHVDAINQGTINGGGVIMCAINATIPANSGVFTAMSIYTPLWLDWKETATVTAGTCTMAFISNNGTTPLDSIFHINAGSTVTNLITMTETGGMVSAEVTADYVFTTYVKVKVNINGVTYYLIADRT